MKIAPTVQRYYLLCGGLAILCIPLASRFHLRETLGFGIIFYSLLGALQGLRVNRPRRRSPWVCFVLSIALQCAGGLIQAGTGGDFGNVLSVADGFLFLAHAAMILSLWQIASRQHRQFPRHGFLQGTIAAISLILIGWQFIFLPTIVKYGFSVTTPQTVRMLYPTMSFIETGMLLWVWISSAAYRSRVFMLLVGATLSFAAGETWFYGVQNSLDIPGDPVLVLWLLGYVGYGGVVLHPAMKQLAIPRSNEENSHVHGVLFLLLPLVLLLPVVLLVTHFKELHAATIGILVGFFLVIVLGWYQVMVSVKNIIQVRRQLERQHRTDYLTGIPNRNHIEHVVHASVRQLGRKTGLLLIDIDGFKAINNKFGFAFGDAIIQRVARHLHAESRKRGCHIARVDGDEFALLMTDAPDGQAVQAQAWEIHRLLDQRIDVRGVSVKLNCSIGVSVRDAFEKPNFSAMLKESEQALNRAKRDQSQVDLYDPAHAAVEDRSWVLNEFRDAIAKGQLKVVYQPKIALDSETVLGAEALIRWEHPQRGLLTPGDFLQEIENTDLIHRLFVSVLREAGTQWQAWSRQALEIGIALNVSARDVLNFDLVSEIKSALEESRMPARSLEIELTESSALSNPSRVKKALADLMDLGVRISIDDYGTGYSSLLYLQQLPLDYLKIDQQFVREMHRDKTSLTIVRSTMELARNLGIKVIAEGVDDPGVYRQLKSLGCYGAQGFLFSQAVGGDRMKGVVQAIESTLRRQAHAGEAAGLADDGAGAR